MANYAIPGTMWPDPYTQVYSGGIVTALSAAGHKAAGIFPAPKAGNVHKVSFRTGPVTTGDTMLVSLQGVDDAGDPDGSVLASQTIALIGTTDNYKTKQVTLASDLAVTVGQELAAVVEFNSWVAGNLQIAAGSNTTSSYPYCSGYATSWAKTGGGPLFTLEYDDGSYAYSYGCLPVATSGANPQNHYVAVDADLQTHEYGIMFRLPFDCRAVGFWALASLVAGAEYNARLYGDTTVTWTGTASKSYIGLGAKIVVGQFNAAANLTANDWYRATLASTNSTGFSLWYMDTLTAAAMDCLTLGQNCYGTSYNSATLAWTDVPTRRYQMGVIVDQETVTSSTATGRPTWREAML